MTQKVDLDHWMFQDKLHKIVDRNVTTEPYEGDTVDKSGIIEDIIELLKSKEYSLLEHKKDYYERNY